MQPVHLPGSRRPSVPALVAALLLSVLVVVVPGAPGAADEAWHPAEDLAVDPVTGNVVVASHGEIRLHDPEGALVAAHQRDGARWIALLGSRAYVLVGASQIAAIDLSTGELAGSWSVEVEPESSIAGAGGRIWFFGSGPGGALMSLDPTTGAIERSTAPGTSDGPYLFDVGRGPNLLLQFSGTAEGFQSRLLDVSGAAPVILAETPRSLMLSPGGVADAPSDRLIDSVGVEFRLSDLTPTGRTHRVGGPLAHSPAKGGIVAAIIRVGLLEQGPTHEIVAGGSTVGLSPDGTRHYTTSAGTLTVTDLAPELAAPDWLEIRSGGLAAVPGQGLGVVTSASVVDLQVDVVDAQPRELTLDLTDVPPGNHELVVTTPWGTAEQQIEVLPASPAPFASWDAFVAQQGRDFRGSAGTPPSRAPFASPDRHIAEVMASPWFEPVVAPVARLYWAYFDRIPDHGGLTFWAARRREGSSLITMSRSFAASREFQRTYGALSDGAFVDLVYANVLDRVPDPGGRAFWVGRLRRGEPRGQVMASFSESSEHVRTMRDEVEVLATYAGMLRRSPSATELERWVDSPRLRLIDEIRRGSPYAARFG